METVAAVAAPASPGFWQVLLDLSLVSGALTVLLLGIAISASGRGLWLLVRALRPPGAENSALLLVRGLRGLVIGLTAAAWASALYWQKGGLFIIGLVILAQETYEMGFLSMILRGGRGLQRSEARADDHP